MCKNAVIDSILSITAFYRVFSHFVSYYEKMIKFLIFIYANNEPKSALARDLGDCRDNKGKLAKRVFTC